MHTLITHSNIIKTNQANVSGTIFARCAWPLITEHVPSI